MKKLNIGLVGYGFMARAHSNAYLSVGQFFDIKYQPVLKAVAARDSEKVKQFAHKWGYESHYADWRRLIDDPAIDVVDIASPNDTHAEIAIAAAAGRQNGPVRKTTGPKFAGSATDERCREKSRCPQHGLV